MDSQVYFLPLSTAGGHYWPDSQNTLFTLEATGYALLALVKLGHMDEAERPFKWLNSQRRRGGGFGSTQVRLEELQPVVLRSTVLLITEICAKFNQLKEVT